MVKLTTYLLFYEYNEQSRTLAVICKHYLHVGVSTNCRVDAESTRVRPAPTGQDRRRLTAWHQRHRPSALHSWRCGFGELGHVLTGWRVGGSQAVLIMLNVSESFLNRLQNECTCMFKAHTKGRVRRRRRRLGDFFINWTHVTPLWTLHCVCYVSAVQRLLHTLTLCSSSNTLLGVSRYLQLYVWTSIKTNESSPDWCVIKGRTKQLWQQHQGRSFWNLHFFLPADFRKLISKNTESEMYSKPKTRSTLL